MITIYHNARCSKSRNGIQFLEDKNIDYTVIQYLKDELTVDELQTLINKLGIEPIELVRTKEAIWKEQFKGKELTKEQIVQAMVDNPKLIERPIVVKGNKAVVARPTEKINEILD